MPNAFADRVGPALELAPGGCHTRANELGPPRGSCIPRLPPTHPALDLGTGPWPLKFGQTTINEAEFEGELDQIRIYDRALTEQEIVQLAGESQ